MQFGFIDNNIVICIFYLETPTILFYQAVTVPWKGGVIRVGGPCYLLSIRPPILTCCKWVNCLQYFSVNRPALPVILLHFHSLLSFQCARAQFALFSVCKCTVNALFSVQVHSLRCSQFASAQLTLFSVCKCTVYALLSVQVHSLRPFHSCGTSSNLQQVRLANGNILEAGTKARKVVQTELNIVDE